MPLKISILRHNANVVAAGCGLLIRKAPSRSHELMEEFASSQEPLSDCSAECLAARLGKSRSGGTGGKTTLEQQMTCASLQSLEVVDGQSMRSLGRS